jgi:hypothetical protein
VIALAVFLILIAASASCSYGTRGRLPYVLVKGAFLAILGAVLGVVAASSALPARIKSYCATRLAADWGAGKRSPWHLRLFWALLRPFLRGA